MFSNASVAVVRLVADLRDESPYPEKVLSSYQMKESWSVSDVADCPSLVAYHSTLSFASWSQRPPTDH